VSPRRRRHLIALLLGAALPPGTGSAAAAEGSVHRGRVLQFPRDDGAHLGAGLEWWYVTGWLGPFAAPRAGFQLTFFRRRTGFGAGSPSRFAARHLLFAHAALTDLGHRRHHHAEKLARWSGDPAAAWAHAGVDDLALAIDRWRLQRDGAGLAARIDTGDWHLDLTLTPTQPRLLQGDAGFSRKGPLEHQASHYVSVPQLQVRARRAGGLVAFGEGLDGRAWLDHEWSDELMAPDAIGWDWAGINLADGAALTAFRLRRADGSTLWAGGSWRPAGGHVSTFAPADVQWTPGRTWSSGRTGARYPVEWRLATPAGRFRLHALLDDQELDARGSTGTVYWEGLSALRADEAAGGANDAPLGLGYLEMTGYAGRLRL
jgi:predicted secreted hydrolase